MRFGSGDFIYEYVENWGQRPQNKDKPDNQEKSIKLKQIAGVSVDSDDNIYVLTRTETPVVVMNKDGMILETFGEGIFGRAHGLFRTREGFLFGVDDQDHAVYKFSPDKQLVMTIGTKGRASDTGYENTDGRNTVLHSAGPFNRPTRLTEDEEGNLYVSDGYGNARIHKFDPSGNLILSWGKPGKEPGQFNLPHGIGLGHNGVLYVADRQNNRVQLFTKNGCVLGEWTDFERPSDIWIDRSGLIFVSECLRTSNFTNSPSRISILNQNGNLLARLEDPDAFYDPQIGHRCAHGMAIDSEGSIYIGNVGQKFPENYSGLAKYKRV